MESTQPSLSGQAVAQHDQEAIAQQAPQQLSYTQRQRKKEAEDQARLVEAIKQGIASAMQPLIDEIKELKAVVEDMDDQPPSAGGSGTRRK